MGMHRVREYTAKHLSKRVRDALLPLAGEYHIRTEHDDSYRVSVSYKKYGGKWKSFIVAASYNTKDSPDPVEKLTVFMGLEPSKRKYLTDSQRVEWAIEAFKACINDT